MDIQRFFKRQPSIIEASSALSGKPLKIYLNELPSDPSERKPISTYHPSQKDEIRRAYLLRGPCQPKGKRNDFPQTLIGDKLRRFNPDWYTEKHGNWLEYSVKTDRVYCLYCYLFKESGLNEAFVVEGVQCWHRKERLDSHVGKCNSFHNKALKLAEMYLYDFTFDEKDKLMYELGHYIANVKEDTRFDNLNGVSDLAKRMVETRKHIDYILVYRLIKLSLVLPVATASVERCFSSMKHVKTELRNRMGDGYINDSCICYN